MSPNPNEIFHGCLTDKQRKALERLTFAAEHCPMCHAKICLSMTCCPVCGRPYLRIDA